MGTRTREKLKDFSQKMSGHQQSDSVVDNLHIVRVSKIHKKQGPTKLSIPKKITMTKTTTESKVIECDNCKKPFPSKNALFRHLKASIGSQTSCLKPEEVTEFMELVVNREENFEKAAILYGYIPSDYYLQRDSNTESSENLGSGLKGGDHAAELLFQSAYEVSLGKKVDEKSMKINRSYGCHSRSKDVQEQLCQDKNTGALNEVMCMRLPPLLYDRGDSEEKKLENENLAIQSWVQSVNKVLRIKLNDLAPKDFPADYHLGNIEVFGRLSVPKKFNAEMDVSHRRIDYLLPADLLYGSKVQSKGYSLEQFCDLLRSFSRKQTTHLDNSKKSQEYDILSHLHHLKRLMQRFCAKVVMVDVVKEKSKKNDDKEVNTRLPEEKKTENITRIKRTMRRRYHNFTPKMMAHEYLAYRRLDRFFHSANVRASEFSSDDFDIGVQSIASRPFIVLSFKGDLFLSGQSRAMIGLFVAIALGYIDEDIMDCIFDEDYTNLVPAPVIPSFAQIATEAWYITWEGKMKYILCPRNCHDYRGWNTPEIISKIENFQEEMYAATMRAWTSCDTEDSVDPNHMLQRCTNWIDGPLKNWSLETKDELVSYRKWKDAKMKVSESTSTSFTIAAALLPSIDSISSTIPMLYETVLKHLQHINSTNIWPSTSLKRQLVMVATGEGSVGYESLVDSHIKAQSNNPERDSAYSFREGEGGASGSFSVGAMPGAQCEPPKGNKLFPELMKAAFELEMALCPDREPSSTIAINRNAQFRPHVDNGAGAGQSRSLIVGLGTYVGGELMVEGKQHDIRYKALEFNGWTERHWTQPFRGERYSLVWFTPKGCEGVKGIDLCR